MYCPSHALLEAECGIVDDDGDMPVVEKRGDGKKIGSMFPLTFYVEVAQHIKNLFRWLKRPSYRTSLWPMVTILEFYLKSLIQWSTLGQMC